MFVPHLKSSNISFFLCLLCDSLLKVFTLLWGWDLTAPCRVSLFCFTRWIQAVSSVFVSSFWEPATRENTGQWYFKSRCGLVHIHKQALRCKRWKRQIKVTKQATFMVSLTRPPWYRYNKRLSFAPSQMFQCHLCIILKDSEPLNYASCYSSGLSSIFNRKCSSICGFYIFSFSKAATTCMS